MGINRRDFIKLTSAAAGGLVLPFISPTAHAKRARIVVAGGGFAGATAAKYLRMWDPSLEVVLIERRPQFISCPMSNLVIGGSRSIKNLTHSYDAIKRQHKVKLLQRNITAIDVDKNRVILGTQALSYDKLIVAPGIDFLYNEIPGLERQDARDKIPHAWQAGAQTVQLRKQLESMPRNGTVILTIPKAPFRCPSGPYERACQIAFYMQNAKPKAKLIVLDANPDVLVKRNQFHTIWKERYGDRIEYHADAEVRQVYAKSGMVKTDFETFRGNVINVIPPQKAGRLADMAGLANVGGRWCEVDLMTYRSAVIPNIHVLGDATFSNLPKSAHIANAQAKVCATAIIAELNEIPLKRGPVFANTCYSFVSANEAMHVAAMYRYDMKTRRMIIQEGAGASERPSRLEAYYARAWAQNIWHDTLG